MTKKTKRRRTHTRQKERQKGRLTQKDVRRWLPSRPEDGSNVFRFERAARRTLDARRKRSARRALRAAQIDLAEALDELSVTRRELDAARADAEAAGAGRAGAVERAAAAAATTTRAENRDVQFVEHRLEDARARLEGTRATLADAAIPRRRGVWPRTSTRVCARPCATSRRGLREAEHLSSARDALELLAARAKAAETQRRLAEAESRHEAETRAGAEDRARFERETLRRAEETAEGARRAAVEAVDAARRETAHELLNTSRAAEAECAPERGEGARRARLAASHRVRGICRGGGVGDDGGGARGGVPAEGHGACGRALQREVDALRGEKKHLWERVEYAEWRLAKLGLDKTTFSPEEAAVAARPGGPSGTETARFRADGSAPPRRVKKSRRVLPRKDHTKKNHANAS